MMMDFGFFSCVSIRGYIAYFSITCQATGYGFVFAVPNKRPHLFLIAWIAETFKRQGRPISFARFDKGGGLARSQQVCQLLTSLNIITHTTGGYSSSLIGKKLKATYDTCGDDHLHALHSQSFSQALVLYYYVRNLFKKRMVQLCRFSYPFRKVVQFKTLLQTYSRFWSSYYCNRRT